MSIIVQLMLLFLIVCAIAVWITMQSPDLAITEAAVGAGITSLLLFLALKKIHAIDARNEVRRKHAEKQRGGEHHGEEE